MTRIYKIRPETQIFYKKRAQLYTKSQNTTTKYKYKTKAKSVLKWLQKNNYENHGVDIRSIEIGGRIIDKTVASKNLKKEDLAFRIPRNLIVTLDRIFEGDTLAELLTTDKLSELACLTLYMMYEKKKGKDSFWYPFIKELDKLRARGPQGAESPILWPEGEADSLLAGSPVLKELKTRINEINKNYNECDTVWYLAGSLFNQYPYDIPTECFSLQLFKSAFVAIQACTVHLQNVPLSRRFALVPLGPPLLSYNSSSQAILKFNSDTDSVDFAVDKQYNIGEPLDCWCGPQLNRRLLINYGIVDDNNPYDSLDVTVTLSMSDPLFRIKRNLLLEHEMTSQEKFQLQRGQPLPPKLFSCLRVACTDSESELKMIDFSNNSVPNDLNVEKSCLLLLYKFFQKQLNKYKTSIMEDEEILSDADTTPRQKVSARLLKIEKEILENGLSEIHTKLKGEEDLNYNLINHYIKLS